jgi:methyl coenzyme M reductase gamma subunit
LNLEDRVEYIKNKVSNILNKKIIFKEEVDNKKKTITLSFKLENKPTSDDINKLENIYNKQLNKLVGELWDVSQDKLSWKTIIQ